MTDVTDLIRRLLALQGEIARVTGKAWSRRYREDVRSLDGLASVFGESAGALEALQERAEKAEEAWHDCREDAKAWEQRWGVVNERVVNMEAANERLTEALRPLVEIPAARLDRLRLAGFDALADALQAAGRAYFLSSAAAPEARTCATCGYHDKRDEPEEGCFFDGKLCRDHSGWTPRKDTQQGDKA